MLYRYIMYIFIFIGYSITIATMGYIRGGDNATNKYIAEQAKAIDIATKNHAKTIDKANNAIANANNERIIYRDKEIIKYVTKMQAESCIVIDNLVQFWNK